MGTTSVRGVQSKSAAQAKYRDAGDPSRAIRS